MHLIEGEKMKRTITIEFDRVKITTTHRHKNLLWCGLCRTQAEFLSSADAADVAKLIKAQGGEVRRENLHFYQPDAREQALVCLNSIINGNNPNIY